MIKKNLGAVTAYAIAKKNGFVGTEQEWLDSLQPKLPDTLVQTVDQTFTEPQQMQARKNLGLPYSQTNRVILPETEFSLTAGDGVSRYYNNYSPARPFGEPEVGRTYTVNLNGTEYEVTAEFWERGETGTSTYSSGVKLGHVEDDIHAGVPENPAYPFGILTITDPGIDGAWGSYLFVYDNVSSATLSITEIGEYIHKLDKKFLPDDIGGPVNWSDIPDKPFTTVGGDTLTWDGNEDGLSSFDGAAFKVSDIVPNLAEIQNGGTATLADGSSTQAFDIVAADISADLGVEGYEIKTLNGMTVGCGLVQPLGEFESGLYLVGYSNSGGVYYVSSLTIPGYTGFTKEVINEDVLPEALRFGDKLVEIVSETKASGIQDGDVYVIEFEATLSGNEERLIVTFDGVEYNCPADTSLGMAIYGNVSLLGGENDTGEPFAVCNMGYMLAFVKDAEMHTICIKAVITKAIDPKYVNPTCAAFYVSSSPAEDAMYLYTDASLSNKATLWDVTSLLGKRPIQVCVASGGMVTAALSPIMIALDLCATIRVVDWRLPGTYSILQYYTAEYTAS